MREETLVYSPGEADKRRGLAMAVEVLTELEVGQWGSSRRMKTGPETWAHMWRYRRPTFCMSPVPGSFPPLILVSPDAALCCCCLPVVKATLPGRGKQEDGCTVQRTQERCWRLRSEGLSMGWACLAMLVCCAGFLASRIASGVRVGPGGKQCAVTPST